MDNSSRGFLFNLIREILKEENEETTKVINREYTPTLSGDLIDFDKLIDLEGDFEITADFLDSTEIEDPDKTRLSYDDPPKYPNRQRVFQDLEQTRTHKSEPYVPNKKDYLPFIDPDYTDPDPTSFYEPQAGTKFGDPVDAEVTQGIKDYLKSRDIDMSPEDHQRVLLKKISKLRRELREGNSWGDNRLRKIIELSIFENIYKRIL